jgi:hypothetical protein
VCVKIFIRCWLLSKIRIKGEKVGFLIYFFNHADKNIRWLIHHSQHVSSSSTLFVSTWFHIMALRWKMNWNEGGKLISSAKVKHITSRWIILIKPRDDDFSYHTRSWRLIYFLSNTSIWQQHRRRRKCCPMCVRYLWLQKNVIKIIQAKGRKIERWD